MLSFRWKWTTALTRLSTGAFVVMSLLGSTGAAPTPAMAQAQGARGGNGRSGAGTHISLGPGSNRPPALGPDRLKFLQNRENDQEADPITPPGPGAANTRSGPPTVPEVQIPSTPSSGAGGSSGAANTFYYFGSSDLGSGSGSLIPEPSLATEGQDVFETWNWYAGLSTNNGSTW